MTAYIRNQDPKQYAQREMLPHYWARRNLRRPEEKALGFSYAFLGVRLQCAQCHKHPFDQWTQDDFKQFTAFFSRVNYGLGQDARRRSAQMREQLGLMGKKGGEIRRLLPQLVKQGKAVPWQEVFVAGERWGRRRKRRAKFAAGRVITPKLLGGEEVMIKQYSDPREPLMDWLRQSDNPYFARAFVNRVWADYFNVGIIDPPDDQNLANPPSNKPLLDYLAAGFIENDYDMKWLHREITTSRTYQLSSRPNDTNRGDERNFSHAVVRRIPAEVAYDAIVQATAGKAQLATLRDQMGQRSIGVGSTVVSRGKRGQGNAYALALFGKPEREAICDCERSNEPSVLQTIYLRNDFQVLSMIDGRNGWLQEQARQLGLAWKPAGARTRISDRNLNRARGGVPATKRQQALAVRRFEAAIQRFKKEGQNKRAAQLEQRLRRLKQLMRRSNAGAPGSRNNNTDRPVAVVRAGTDGVRRNSATDQKRFIREAYLRTVSRPPKPEEIARVQRYLRESPDTVSGMRDTLWALLNTKEFITNH